MVAGIRKEGLTLALKQIADTDVTQYPPMFFMVAGICSTNNFISYFGLLYYIENRQKIA
jgi:hypothetical protein